MNIVHDAGMYPTRRQFLKSALAAGCTLAAVNSALAGAIGAGVIEVPIEGTDNVFSGHIKEFRYYSRRLSNKELEALSSGMWARLK